MSNIQIMRHQGGAGALAVASGSVEAPENMAPLTVGLVQINNSFSGQNYLPYAVGMLQAYVQKHAKYPQRYTFMLPVYSRLRVAEAIERMHGADVVSFSAYVWNIRISLEIARRIKAKHPSTLIVFGGPQVPDRAEAFLRQNQFIDIVCHGEGEHVFLSILENFPSKTWENISSVSYLREDGTFVNNPRAARLKDITAIPSPYLSGIFDPLMRANPHEKWLILWETNRGCPFQCTFCDWGSAIAAKVSQFDMERLIREVDWFAEKRIEFIFCCDANFGMLPRDYDIVHCVAERKRILGYPQALSVQNTKNATERAYLVQKLLSDAGLNKGVALSLQSVDPGTLKAIKRQNISTDSYQELQRRFTRDRVETYSDLILGLPGETYESFADGVSDVMENGQHNRIQFNNLSILPNAEMGDPEYQKKYGMEIVESCIINIHGALDESEEVQEMQQLVVATAAMPREDWVKTRTFCWMTAFLHFDKVLQLPLIIVHELCGGSYRDLIEAFIDADPARYPVLSRIKGFFADKARDIQSGGLEYCHSKKWLGIFWPADEYVLIELCVEEKLTDFYREAETLLQEFVDIRGGALPQGILREAMELNRSLVKLPFQTQDLEIKTSYNIWEFYRAVLVGESVTLDKRSCINRINRTKLVYRSWGDWCREVIWYGNKKGAYLYGNDLVERELAGHY